MGSNRQFIESVIPHIGSLLCDDMQTVIATADLVLIGTQAVAKDHVTSLLRPDQKLIDLMRLEEFRPVLMATAVSKEIHPLEMSRRARIPSTTSTA